MKLSDFQISLLVAYTKKNRIIGSDGKIPWNLTSERYRFKQLCNQKIVIMGRKTFEEIGHALPYCTILIISRTIKNCPEGCLLAESLEEAIKIIGGRSLSLRPHFVGAYPLCGDTPQRPELLVAGGQEIYQQFLPFASKIFATEINQDFKGDRTFPELTKETTGKTWQRILEETRSENGITYEYVTYLPHNSDQQ